MRQSRVGLSDMHMFVCIYHRSQRKIINLFRILDSVFAPLMGLSRFAHNYVQCVYGCVQWLIPFKKQTLRVEKTEVNDSSDHGYVHKVNVSPIREIGIYPIIVDG